MLDNASIMMYYKKYKKRGETMERKPKYKYDTKSRKLTVRLTESKFFQFEELCTRRGESKQAVFETMLDNELNKN